MDPTYRPAIILIGLVVSTLVAAFFARRRRRKEFETDPLGDFTVRELTSTLIVGTILMLLFSTGPLTMYFSLRDNVPEFFTFSNIAFTIGTALCGVIFLFGLYCVVKWFVWRIEIKDDIFTLKRMFKGSVVIHLGNLTGVQAVNNKDGDMLFLCFYDSFGKRFAKVHNTAVGFGLLRARMENNLQRFS